MNHTEVKKSKSILPDFPMSFKMKGNLNKKNRPSTTITRVGSVEIATAIKCN